ncbi:MAG: CDP-alcohol phosphatidyltransferase family protein [Chloroflexi bacterium]|nr:CDP-alcohol phosphatidyltransferase family protein [Chloroflexota bacterium]
MTSPTTPASPSADAGRAVIKRVATRWVVDPIVRALAKTGVTPDMLTFIGLLGGVAAGVVLGTGHLVIGGAVVLAGSALDMFDGALARATNKVSKAGALLDSTIDRIAEAAIFAGLLYHFVQSGATEQSLLIFAAMTGGVMVSYVKARAEGLGLSCNVGIFTRPERVIFLGFGLLIGQILPFLYIVAILSWLTAAHRYMHSAAQARAT